MTFTFKDGKETECDNCKSQNTKNALKYQRFKKFYYAKRPQI